MPADLPPGERAALDNVVRRLDTAWNAMDGPAFAAPFDAPQGPLAGGHGARFSLVLTKESGGWEIAALHNTVEAAPGPPR
jgi:hypothetical protein